MTLSTCCAWRPACQQPARPNEQVSPLEAGLRRFCNDFAAATPPGDHRPSDHRRQGGQLPRGVAARWRQCRAPQMVDGRKVGGSARAVQSIALDQPIALAYLHRPNHEPGTEVIVQSAGAAIMAEVVALPFTSLDAPVD